MNFNHDGDDNDDDDWTERASVCAYKMIWNDGIFIYKIPMQKVYTTTHNDHRRRRRTTIMFLLQHNITERERASEHARKIGKKIALFMRWMSQIRTATNVLYVYMCMYKISIDSGFFVDYYHCCCRLVHLCFSVLETIHTFSSTWSEWMRGTETADTVAALSLHPCRGLLWLRLARLHILCCCCSHCHSSKF